LFFFPFSEAGAPLTREISCQRGRKQETFNAGSGTLYSERRLGFNSSFFFCDRMNMTVLFLNLEFLTCFLESARRFSSFFFPSSLFFHGVEAYLLLLLP